MTHTNSARSIRRWGLLWRSENRLDGAREHIICADCQPVLFQTREGARRYASEKYGYIKGRVDLQREPHGWKAPIPVKLTIAAEMRGEKA